MNRIFLFLVAVMAIFSACNKEIIPVKPVKPPFEVVSLSKDSIIPEKPGGVFYILPRSRIDVALTLRRTETIKGPYSSFASKYLGIENVVIGNAVTWQIEEIEFFTSPVPDIDEIHYVALGGIDSSSIPLQIQLCFNNNGSLSGNHPIEKKPIKHKHSNDIPKYNYSSVFKYFADNNLFETVDTIIEHIDTDSVIIEHRVYRTKMVEKPIEQRAKEAADFILELKEQRLKLLTGFHEVPYDPATIKYMNSSLENMEREYIELFTGISYENVYTHNFSYVPEKRDDCIPIPLTRFSMKEGILPLNSNKGEIVYLQVCSKGVRETVRSFFDTYDNYYNEANNNNDTLSDTLILYSEDSVRISYNTGFVYRIPEWTELSVYLGNKKLKESGMTMPQFGETHRLPYFITRFRMDPSTGAVIEIIYP